MNKILKALAATAALAAVVPFHGEGDKTKGSIKALLWRADWNIDPDYQSQSDINVLVGFNNPFEGLKKESELFADDLVVDYCCDEGITPNTVMYRDEDCQCEDECDCQCEDKCADECSCGCAEAEETAEEGSYEENTGEE